MKKHKIIKGVSVVILVLILTVAGVFIYNYFFNDKYIKKNEDGMYNVPVSSWDDPHSRYIICEIEDKRFSPNYGDYYTTFRSDLTLDELAEQNGDFLKRIKYYSRLMEYDANLYFHNNNYYVIFYVPGNDKFDAYYKAMSVSCYLYPEKGISIATAPLPMDLTLSSYVVTDYRETYDESYLKYFFDNLTFEDVCEFYDKYENGVAEYDKENKLIYVDVREKTGQKTYHEKYLCIDFNNRQFICDKGGENEYIFE